MSDEKFEPMPKRYEATVKVKVRTTAGAESDETVGVKSPVPLEDGTMLALEVAALCRKRFGAGTLKHDEAAKHWTYTLSRQS